MMTLIITERYKAVLHYRNVINVVRIKAALENSFNYHRRH